MRAKMAVVLQCGDCNAMANDRCRIINKSVREAIEKEAFHNDCPLPDLNRVIGAEYVTSDTTAIYTENGCNKEE